MSRPGAAEFDPKPGGETTGFDPRPGFPDPSGEAVLEPKLGGAVAPEPKLVGDVDLDPRPGAPKVDETGLESRPGAELVFEPKLGRDEAGLESPKLGGETVLDPKGDAGLDPKLGAPVEEADFAESKPGETGVLVPKLGGDDVAGLFESPKLGGVDDVDDDEVDPNAGGGDPGIASNAGGDDAGFESLLPKLGGEDPEEEEDPNEGGEPPPGVVPNPGVVVDDDEVDFVSPKLGGDDADEDPNDGGEPDAAPKPGGELGLVLNGGGDPSAFSSSANNDDADILLPPRNNVVENAVVDPTKLRIETTLIVVLFFTTLYSIFFQTVPMLQKSLLVLDMIVLLYCCFFLFRFLCLPSRWCNKGDGSGCRQIFVIDRIGCGFDGFVSKEHDFRVMIGFAAFKRHYALN